MTYGGFSVKKEWNEGGVNRIDAILIVLGRIWVIMLIISIILTVIGSVFAFKVVSATTQ